MNFIPIWWIVIPFTIIYVAGAISAFNVTDGMDGLCAGISLISCIGYFFLGLKSGNVLLCSFSGILFMSLLGFLPYNFHPAKIFLGDAGSGFLGFMLGTMAVMATSRPYDIVNFIAVILVIGLPVFDIAFAILRRLFRRKPLFTGDRNHLYDLLLKKGWSQPKVWSVMCGIQSVLVGVALVLVYHMQ
jgi:UDP-GlcNAc:undecaprenyl-phosphate/decaprenyl-phosphate GlcNAc-1-phosphate transferase